ncbi:hypothetical protein ACFLZC_00105 [Patescibacteria group bacterium]
MNIFPIQIQVDSGIKCRSCKKKRKRIVIFAVEMSDYATSLNICPDCLKKQYEMSIDDKLAKEKGVKIKYWKESA